MTFETVRAIALALPGVEEGTSYGTPGFRVKGKFLARLREDGETLVIKISFEERDMLMASDPQVYFITDHYVGYPSVLVCLPKADAEEVADVLELAWRQAAPKKLVAAYDEPASRQ